MSDDEEDTFGSREVRHKFVRKVLSIVGAQLLLTVLFVACCVYVDEVKIFVLSRKNVWIFWVCTGVTLICLLALMCIVYLRRKFPINIILLTLFTIAESYVIGYTCAGKYPNEVVLAFGITVVVCGALILFAWQVKFDFTGLGPYMLIVFVVLLIMGIVAIFWRNRIFLIVMCSIGILAFSIYLIIDIQMMLGGSHKYQYDPEDYVVAAVSIYIDIINIFMYLLQLIGLVSND